MTNGNGVVIDVESVTRIYRVQRTRRTLFRVLKDYAASIPAPTSRPALNGVSLTVTQGGRVAVIGNNAAGKSTLLRIVAGILRPTAGRVRVNGEMVLLTSLGAGMIDDVSILDNTLLYGALYGVDPKQMRRAFGEVLDWAEITAPPQAQLKTLSLGTRGRLAFSIVRQIAADILIIDEALSAGDRSFQVKARAFFDEPRHDARTFLVATHDMKFVRTFCTEAIWLHEGRIMAAGPSGEVVDRYLATQPPDPGE